MDTLIVMTKGGEFIEVHPSCVADHQRLGWVVVDTPPVQNKSPETPKRKKAQA